MKSLSSKSICILALLLKSQMSHSIVPFQGAREIGMSNAVPSLNSSYNSFCNPAMLATNQKVALGISYNNPYQIKELSTQSIIVIFPTLNGGFGGGWDYFGTSVYNEQILTFGYGHSLNEKIEGGILLNYYATHLTEDYETYQAVSGNIGITVHPNTNLSIAVQIQNITNNNYISHSNEELQASLNTGVAWHFENFLIGSSLNINKTRTAQINVGSEYLLAKNFAIRAGIATNTNVQYTFGAGYGQKWWKGDIAFGYHNQLGMASFFSVEFLIGKEKK